MIFLMMFLKATGSTVFTADSGSRFHLRAVLGKNEYRCGSLLDIGMAKAAELFRRLGRVQGARY